MSPGSFQERSLELLSPGLSFGAWRAQLRLMRALELLAQDHPVLDVALALGYESPSAFIPPSAGTSARRRHGTSRAEPAAIGLDCPLDLSGETPLIPPGAPEGEPG